MAKKTYPDVRPGQIWRDRDSRMMSGNRRVLVISTTRDGDRCTVQYRDAVGGDYFRPPFKSSYHRFQRAFELVSG